jgi:hypothetical protein
MTFKNVKPKWDLEKLRSTTEVQGILEEKLGAIECENGNVEVQGDNIEKCVTDIIIFDFVHRQIF